MTAAISRFTISVAELDRSLPLYENVLGLTRRYALLADATIIDEAADQAWGERQSVLHDLDGHVLCLVAPLG